MMKKYKRFQEKTIQNGKINLADYLIEKEEELIKLNKEVSFLQSIQMPLMLHKYGNNQIQFYSDNYHFATNFEIKKRDGHCNIEGISNYDGGYNYSVHEFYPQFYFKIKDGKKSVQVYIQHKDFDNDEKIVFKKIKECRGYGGYANKTKRELEYIDLKKVFSYFNEKGVNKPLLNNLEKKIKELKLLD